MKRNLLFCMVFAAVVALSTFIACDSAHADEPTTDPAIDAKPTEPADSPIEPLPEDLRAIYTEGKRWVVNDDPTKDEIATYAVVGNTEFDGLEASIFAKIDHNGNPIATGRIVREDGSRVYNVYYIVSAPGTASRPELRLSFDVDPREGGTISSTYESTIISRGIITLMGKERRAVKVWSDNEVWSDTPYDYWVEGIGPLFGQIPNYNTIQPTGIWGIFGSLYYRLLECYDGEEKIYDYREFRHDLYRPVEIFSEVDK